MNKPVILCVDDERTVLSSLKAELIRLLEQRCLVEIAESGEEGLEVCAEVVGNGTDLPVVISDYIMPGMKGDEFLRKIHDLSPSTMTIMLTGQASLDAVTNAVNQAKLYRYIAKPWHSEDLKLTVTEALRSYSQSRQLAALTREQADLIEKLRANESRLTQFTGELERLNRAYEKFLPKQFLKLLNKESILDIRLGDQVEKEMSVLFSDIRGFTGLAENMTPQDNFNFINAYLRRMEPIITAHGGFIDKYIGDAIMALFPCKADDAVKAGIALFAKLEEYNKERQADGYPPFQIGVGINTGLLMLGVVGGQEHLEGTVIADAVNLSARIEGLTKTYGSPLLISEETYLRLENPEVYLTRRVDHVTVKGKTQPVTVREVFEVDPPAQRALKQNTLLYFNQGFEYFHGGRFAAAKAAFEHVLASNPADPVARIYLEHCKKVLSMQVPETPTILVVDDTPVNILLLTRLLSRKGYKVLSAENGEAALEIARTHPLHLILLDIMMPGLDGFETCAQLKAGEETQEIPVIFMTTLSELENKVRGFQLGAVDYITKPFQSEEVLIRIHTHLSNAYLHRQLQLRNVELEINNLQLKEKIDNLGRQADWGL